MANSGTSKREKKGRERKRKKTRGSTEPARLSGYAVCRAGRVPCFTLPPSFSRVFAFSLCRWRSSSFLPSLSLPAAFSLRFSLSATVVAFALDLSLGRRCLWSPGSSPRARSFNTLGESEVGGGGGGGGGRGGGNGCEGR